MYIVESDAKYHNPLILKQNKHKGYGEVNKKDNEYGEYCLSCSPLHILCVYLVSGLEGYGI